MEYKLKLFLNFCALFVVVACGGGGGSSFSITNNAQKFKNSFNLYFIQ